MSQLSKPWKIWVWQSGHVEVATEQPEGTLPALSTETKEEADSLVLATCKLSRTEGVYICQEVVDDPSLEGLLAFTDRLIKLQNERASK